MFDDGSLDGTPEVVERCAEADGRITLVGAERVGLVAALWRLINRSNAEFLARMDADDISHPERLEAQVAMLETQPDLAAVGCRVRHFSTFSEEGSISREGVPGGMRRYEEWLNRLITPEQILQRIREVH